MREAGSEGIELVMWLIARGAMADCALDAAGQPAAGVAGRKPREIHRFHHVPASNTSVGHLVLQEV